MKIDLYDLITLDNNKKYVLGSIIEHNNIDYYLLCDELNPKQYMFCYLKENKLVKVKDDNIIKILSLKITKDLLK